jgi:ribonuclease PH
MTTLETMKIDSESEMKSSTLRKDGRSNLDMQEIFIQKGSKINYSSSLYLETTHLKLLCSVNGPVYLSSISKSKTDDANKMNINVSLVFPSYLEPAPNKNSIEMLLEELFSQNILVDKYPRTKLNIKLDVFEYKCDILPFAVMAISLALVYANIEQKGLSTCANMIVKNGEIIVDPTTDEENGAEFKLTFGSLVDFQENNIFIQNGSVENNVFKKVIGTAIKMCEAYQKFLISKLN